MNFLNSQEVDKQDLNTFIEHSTGDNHLGLYKVTKKTSSQEKSNRYLQVMTRLYSAKVIYFILPGFLSGFDASSSFQLAICFILDYRFSIGTDTLERWTKNIKLV